MNHPIYRITDCSCIAPHTLRLRFDDGLELTIDLSDVLEGEVYGPLKDPFTFARVTIDREIGTVVWPNGADFDPAILHDWDKHKITFSTAAKRWKSQPVTRVAEGAPHVRGGRLDMEDGRWEEEGGGSRG